MVYFLFVVVLIEVAVLDKFSFYYYYFEDIFFSRAIAPVYL